MATLTAGEAKQVAPKAKSAAQQVEVAAPSRREFLYYVWGASIVLLLGQATAGIIWFALPRFKEGTFGGVFSFAPDRLLPPGVAPVTVSEGRFHVVRDGNDGLNTLYAVCTHLGCLPKWSSVNARFECPCHGSKFQLDGSFIEGPAPRNLDRFETTVTFDDGSTATNSGGQPIPLNGRTVRSIAIDTGARIQGARHA
jgi:cytochrome b6-f complex iron-sulfur subunit